MAETISSVELPRPTYAEILRQNTISSDIMPAQGYSIDQRLRRRQLQRKHPNTGDLKISKKNNPLHPANQALVRLQVDPNDDETKQVQAWGTREGKGEKSLMVTTSRLRGHAERKLEDLATTYLKNEADLHGAHLSDTIEFTVSSLDVAMLESAERMIARALSANERPQPSGLHDVFESVANLVKVLRAGNSVDLRDNVQFDNYGSSLGEALEMMKCRVTRQVTYRRELNAWRKEWNRRAEEVARKQRPTRLSRTVTVGLVRPIAA